MSIVLPIINILLAIGVVVLTYLASAMQQG